MDESAARRAATALLQSLSTHDGIRASSSSQANYGAVFARDAIMAGIAGLLTGDERVQSGLRHTLANLRMLQGREGQIASNYMMREGQAPQASFGTLVPRVDAALWYLIGVGMGARHDVVDPNEHREAVAKVVHLLNALEYNGRHLLYLPVGADWADEYIYEGYVLHDQVLRAWGLRLVGTLYEQASWTEQADRIGDAIGASFWPAADPARRFPLAAFTPTRVYDLFDLATCALLAVSNVAPRLADAALDFAGDSFLAHDRLPPAFHPVIDEAHADWPALSRYHLHGFRNHPHEYHNGGVWPIWLGWLALALARTGRAAQLHTLRQLVHAHLSAFPDFAFEEYFHGLTGAPSGTPHMAYSATGVLFLSQADAPVARSLFSV